ncbi:MAG TPA: ATP-binding protein [Candidatus Obscuribacterales bacterium]
MKLPQKIRRSLSRNYQKLQRYLEQTKRSISRNYGFQFLCFIVPYLLGIFLLRQVLINLLSNAIKFTPEGGITLTVFQEEDSTDIVMINFKIRDTGVGISEAELPKLFEAFTQTQAGKESQEGTGLGLAISRKFVQLMGGDITVESQLGQGTTFSFQIQAKPGHNINDESLKTRQKVLGLAPGQPTYKILTVDDKEINCLYLGVKYVYAETQPILNPVLQDELTSDALTVMSQDWISQLYKATLEADAQVVMQLITEIPDTQIFLIQSLTQLARKFQFEQIIELTEILINYD